MRPLAYPVGKSAEVWAALVAGFGADAVTHAARRLQAGRLAILGGLQFDTPGLLRQARADAHPYVFVDNGYFRTHEGNRRVRYRVVRDAYCQWWINRRRAEDLARFEALALKIQPWRTTGRHVLVYTSSPAHAAFFGLERWHLDVTARIRAHTDRPVLIWKKGDVTAAQLEAYMLDAWAVVTWSSKLACEAILAGVPAFVGPESAAAPVAFSAERHLDLIERPYLAGNRLEWASALAWGQFTVGEIASGLAASVAAEALADREAS